MEKTITKGFSIAILDKNHNRKTFSCGIDSLDKYFHERASQDSRKRIAVTYILEDEDTNKVGYYTLSAATIELIALPEEIRKKLPSYPCIPATLIGRLAIDNSYKKRGLGEIMLVDALKSCYHASLKVASFAVVVDAINNSAEKFYKKYGFLNLTSNSPRLFLPMTVIGKLLF